ncbi:MAG: hypothetical protein JXA71_11260 [Chitinispirillaceae bacterium]|nr:hypothetical protein [Chitinispirillaceae bacterium]
MKSLRRCCRLFLAGYAGTLLGCQSGIESEDPYYDLTEYVSVHQYLSAYSIWQDRVPVRPFDFPYPDSILRSVHDTLRGNWYTRYADERYRPPAYQANPVSTVFLDTLTDSTALLTISAFGQTTYYDFLRCAPLAYRFKNIVVDLRQNRGGYIDILDSLIQAFLPGGTPYIQARYREYNDTLKRYVTREWRPWSMAHGPMVAFLNKRFAVLMDGMSASASEILIAGLYEGTGAALIGSRSYGKGIGQVLVSRRTRPSIQITFLRLKGISDRIGDYHTWGIDPDTVPQNVAQEGAALDSSYQPVFYAVRTLEPQVRPYEIRYPPSRNAPPPVSGSGPQCLRIVDEENVRSLFAR